MEPGERSRGGCSWSFFKVSFKDMYCLKVLPLLSYIEATGRRRDDAVWCLKFSLDLFSLMLVSLI